MVEQRILLLVVAVHQLATHYDLVQAAKGKELIINDEAITPSELQALVLETGVLAKCTLLQDMNVVEPISDPEDDQKIKEFVFDRMATQKIVGRPALVQYCLSKCLYEITDAKLEKSIQELCEENKIKILNPRIRLEAQVIRLIPEEAWMPESASEESESMEKVET